LQVFASLVFEFVFECEGRLGFAAFFFWGDAEFQLAGQGFWADV